jgi:hypothetical protein
MTEEDPQNCTDLETISEAKFLCEVCHKNQAVFLCSFCGLRVCSKCMNAKPRRLCCHREPYGDWEK